MARTRSAAIKESMVKKPLKEVRAEKPKKPISGLRSGLNRAQNATAIVKSHLAKKVKLARAGLRSGRKLHQPKIVAKEKTKPIKKKPVEIKVR